MNRVAKNARAWPSNRRLACGRRVLFIVLGLLAIALPAAAIQPVGPEQNARPKLARAFVAPELAVQADLGPTVSLAPGRQLPAKPGVDAFVRKAGGQWEMRWDRRSDRPNLIQGSGVALLPGRGNALSAADVGLRAGEAVGLATVESRLRGFAADHADLLGTQGLEFRLDPNASVPYGDGSTHWFVEFAQYAGGVRVDRAHLFFRLSHGNLVQFGTERVAPVAISTQPSIDRADAFAAAWRELAFPAGTRIGETLEAGELLVLPTLPAGEQAAQAYRGPEGGGYAHRLAWRFVFRLADDPSTYEVLFDAHAGNVIEVRNLTVNVDATVTGGVYPTTNSDPEIVVPMPFAAVSNGGAKITDALGIYDYAGGTATTSLDGKYFRMSDGCGAISLSNSNDGNLALGTSGGTDCTTPGVGGAGNTHASRTGFYHLTNINRKAVTFFPGNAWLASKVTANMNVNDVCNAGWNGSTLNFFKSGAGCSNTGEIAAVFLHEWGHGMDTNTGGAASEYGSGEAVGDTFAFLETKDACIGKNFKPGVPCTNCDASCTGVRDVEAFSTHGAATIARPSTIEAPGGPDCDRWSCPYYQQGIFPYQGPMGYEGHCESYIASSANWDLTQALIEKYGEQQGWQEMDRIWYGSLVPSKSAYRVSSGGQCNVNAQVDGCGSNNWYTVFLAADDDDGNLANGTPNACRIWDAFDAHGIACGARPACSADAPDFTLAVADPNRATCAPGSVAYAIAVGSQMGFGNPVTLSVSGVPTGVDATIAPNPVVPGTGATLTLTATGAAAAGTSAITLSGAAADSPGHSVPLQLSLTVGAPDAPAPVAPADGATGLRTRVELGWQAAANAATYTLEVATDPAFTQLVTAQTGLAATSYAVDGLVPQTTYYWRVTAANACGSGATSAVFRFTTANMLCASPNAAIPDGAASGVSSTITAEDASRLSGLKVLIRADHTYVGDLSFTLSRSGGGSSLLINRPGRNGSGFGCDGADIDVLLDDAAATSVQNQCNATPPAIAGTQKPNAPVGSAFAGQPLAGAWTLKAVDNATGDSGKLVEWCLLPDLEAAPQTYTVGGTVAGLAGVGLVLKLNGDQELPVGADGPFAFPAGLGDGSPYEVSVAAQPTLPTQRCTVTNGSGTIAAANVADVAIACETIIVDRIFMSGFEALAPGR